MNMMKLTTGEVNLTASILPVSPGPEPPGLRTVSAQGPGLQRWRKMARKNIVGKLKER